MKFSNIAILALVYNISALRVHETVLAEVEDDNTNLAQEEILAEAEVEEQED
jgi:hypothetical protein